MAFFKRIRDHLKANGFTTRLELALQNLNLNDIDMCEYQLRKAQQAMIALRTSEAEYIFSEHGLTYIWNLVRKLRERLDAQGCDQLACDVEHIATYILQVVKKRSDGEKPTKSRMPGLTNPALAPDAPDLPPSVLPNNSLPDGAENPTIQTLTEYEWLFVKCGRGVAVFWGTVPDWNPTDPRIKWHTGWPADPGQWCMEFIRPVTPEQAG